MDIAYFTDVIKQYRKKEGPWYDRLKGDILLIGRGPSRVTPVTGVNSKIWINQFPISEIKTYHGGPDRNYCFFSGNHIDDIVFKERIAQDIPIVTWRQTEIFENLQAYSWQSTFGTFLSFLCFLKNRDASGRIFITGVDLIDAPERKFKMERDAIREIRNRYREFVQSGRVIFLCNPQGINIQEYGYTMVKNA